MKVIKVFNQSSAQSNMSLTVNINTKKLEMIEAALNKKFKTQVGILGDKALRQQTEQAKSGRAVPQNGTQSTQTNAQIGLVHEFGSYTRKIPERSFLLVPLLLHLGGTVNESAAKINKAIEMADVARAYAVLGVAAEKVIQEAFATGGYGKWPKLKPATIARKGSSAILIDSAQLRKSITSKVVSA